MANILLFLPLSLLLLLSPIRASNPNPNSDKPSGVHTELIKHGFPTGLLPTNVHKYTVNQTTNEFAVFLHDKCRLTLPPDNYLATYSRKITGKIVDGRIADLNGINVWAFFKWWGITGIRSNGEDLVFEVGMMTAKYPSKNFDESPPCEGKHSSS
ncbi:hypothetical protein RJ640_024268 [Escallonia rubra]|uniref:Uncharacterized protein n=1 Tax=Escallonia rubra TaxID=112253 RepID=A0AA88RQQ8_9ASTE|nr:hypothetical protein RJ640_024268 [Escallonia rubra]